MMTSLRQIPALGLPVTTVNNIDEYDNSSIYTGGNNTLNDYLEEKKKALLKLSVLLTNSELQTKN